MSKGESRREKAKFETRTKRLADKARARKRRDDKEAEERKQWETDQAAAKHEVRRLRQVVKKQRQDLANAQHRDRRWAEIQLGPHGEWHT